MDGETRTEGHGNNTYCSMAWRHFWEPYNNADNYVKVVVCGIGVLTNLLNIWIFTRPRMRRINPQLNLIFIALSITDLAGTLRKFIELSLYLDRKSHGGDTRLRYRKTLDKLIHDLFLNLFHSYSVWLTVILAAWIYFATTNSNFTTKTRICCSRCFCGLRDIKRKAELTIFVTILGSSLIVALMFVDARLEIIERSYGGHPKKNPHYIIDRSRAGLQLYHGCQMLFIKLVPCVILTVLSVKSVFVLRQTDKQFKLPESTSPLANFRPKFLSSSSTLTRDSDQPESDQHHSRPPTENAIDHKTRTLILAISTLFLLTEFPSAIFRVTAGATLSLDFMYECYMPPFHFFQLNEFLSCVLNFFVYTGMNEDFRAVLLYTFRNCREILLCRKKVWREKSKNSVRRGAVENSRNNYAMAGKGSNLTIMEGLSTGGSERESQTNM